MGILPPALSRNASARLTLLVVICLGHVGLFVVVQSLPDGRRRERPEATQERLLVTFIERLVRAPEPPSEPHAPVREPRVAAPVSPSPISAVVPEVPQSPADAASTAPTIDWNAEAERVARSALTRRGEEETWRRFGEAPEGMGPPPPPGKRGLGQSEQHVGGEAITWIDEHCYYTNQPPPGPDLGPLRLQLPVCKPKRNRPNWYEDIETWRKSRGEPEPPP